MPSVAMVTFNNNGISALFDQVIISADPYQAAALYPCLNASQRSACEKIIFAHRRYPRIFAQASYTPVSLLQRLALQDDSLVLDKLVRNPATPMTVLKQLAQKTDSEQRLKAIAAHPNASSALLGSLSHKDSLALRRTICHNPNTGLIQLNRLFVLNAHSAISIGVLSLNILFQISMSKFIIFPILYYSRRVREKSTIPF